LTINQEKPVVDRMNGEIRKALETPEVRAFMPREAPDSIAGSPEEPAALFKREVEKYARVIKQANIRAG